VLALAYADALEALTGATVSTVLNVPNIPNSDFRERLRFGVGLGSRPLAARSRPKS